MKFADLFCGIGGFHLGLSKVGFECVWANDNNKYANIIYRKHFGDDILDTRDIREVEPEEIPDHDILTGGFPCQSFSLSGLRKGFEDVRGTLFYDVARIASVKRPKLLFLENVKGLLSAQKGYCFSKIIQTLDELGYDVQWQCLNSKYFGVPQSRGRVFIIGHLRGERRPEIFPIGRESGETSTRTVERKKLDLNPKTSYALDANYWKGSSLSNVKKKRRQLVFVGGIEEGRRLDDGKDLSRNYSQGSRVYDADGVASSITSSGVGREGGHTGLYIVAERGRYKDDGTIEQVGEPRFNGCTNSLTSANKDNNVVLGRLIRRLTPTECERLQGFPDGWTEGLSDTQRYRLLGNAVTTNVINYIGKCIMKS